jgi:hypothetical protein
MPWYPSPFLGISKVVLKSLEHVRQDFLNLQGTCLVLHLECGLSIQLFPICFWNITVQDLFQEACILLTEKKEKDTKASFDTLMTAKNSQLSAAQDALSGGEGEGASRTLAADEAQAEVDALTTQVSNDEKYISQAEASYGDKVGEWKERKRLRTGEAAAVSKAMAVLTSDDARDTFSASHKSQTGFFLQEDESANCHRAKAVNKLRETAA